MFRRDLVIGIAVSFLIHGTVYWFGHGRNPPPPPPVKEVDHTVTIVMPKIEPDEPEEVEQQQQQQPTDIAPPMQTDVPQMITPDSITQPIEPPPPDVTAFSKTAVTIPQNRSLFGKGVEVFDISKLDQQPEPTYRAKPVYPYDMKRESQSGEVIVDFYVDTSGNVRNASAVRSSQREFEEPAVQAVSKWKFRPGRKNGHAVFTHMQVPIEFKLDENS